jgi:hypothetical protein
VKRHLPTTWLLLPWGFACAASGVPDDPTGAGGVAWTTSANGGAGGDGGADGGQGLSRGGGATTSAGGLGGSGGDAGGAGGSAPATVIVLATGGSGVLQGAFDGASWSATTTPSPTSSVPPALSVVGGMGLGVVATDASMPNLPLVFATFGGAWNSFAAVGAVTRAAPALTGGALVYHAPDYKHALALYAGSWNPIDEAIAPPAQPQSFGPTPPRATLLAGNPLVAFAGDDTQLYLQLRSGGTWSAATFVPGAAVQAPPAMVALSAGPELLAVWVHHAPSTVDHTKLFWASRSSGVWSTPVKISEDVFTPEAPNLTALAGGDALVAFRGTDGKGYSLRWSGGAWSSVLPLAADVITTPAVSAGAPGADAELAFVAPGGAVEHMRLSGTTWSAPSSVGGSGLQHAAIVPLP